MHFRTLDPRPGAVLRRASTLSLWALALAGFVGHVEGQQGRLGSVRGSVVESDSNKPVRSATVVLVPLSASESEGASTAASKPSTVSTDGEGRYAFENVAPGRYRIEVSGLGYRSARIWIDLPRPWAVRRSVALQVEPVELDPVEIVLPKPRPRVAPDLTVLPPSGVPAPTGTTAGASAHLFALDTHVLDPANLPQSGPLGEPDVLRALDRLPSVSVRGDFSANLWTRGAPWGMTAILLDGLPLYDPLHLGGIVSGLSADGLESVALMPGVRPPSAAEGAAGTIALTTRRADHRAASVGLSSLAVRTRVEDRFLDDRVGVMVAARRSWWDLVSPPPILAASESRNAIDYRLVDVSGRFDVRLGSTGLLEGGGLWEDDRLHGDVAGVVSASEGRWGNRLGWLKLSRSFGGIHAETKLGRVAYRVATRPLPWYAFIGTNGVPSLDQVETSIDHTSLQTSLRGRDTSGHVTWGAGLEVAHERLTQFGIDASDRGVPGVHGPADLSRLRGWTEATVTLGTVDIAGGLGAAWLPGDADSPPALPSARLRWSPTSWLTLEGARGRSAQFVYPLAPAGVSLGPALGVGYTWVIAGARTPPLVSDISTLSAALSFLDGAFLQVTRWRRGVDGVWLSGVARLTDDGLQTTDANVDGGVEHGRGVETRLGWRDHRFDIEAGYSLGRSRFQDPSGPSWPSPAERRHSLDLHAQGYVTSALDVALDYTSESGWPLVLGPARACGDLKDLGCVDATVDDSLPTRYSFGESPRYESLDVTVRWGHRWKRLGLDLAASVNNVLGRGNPQAYRAGTCVGPELFSSVCDLAAGLPSFSPGLTRPTPSVAVKVRF